MVVVPAYLARDVVSPLAPCILVIEDMTVGMFSESKAVAWRWEFCARVHVPLAHSHHPPFIHTGQRQFSLGNSREAEAPAQRIVPFDQSLTGTQTAPSCTGTSDQQSGILYPYR